MKSIVWDSMWAHLLMFWFLLNIVFDLVLIAPTLFVLFGSFHVLLIFKSAINIADFEMSDVGKFVEKAESGKYKRIEVKYFK